MIKLMCQRLHRPWKSVRCELSINSAMGIISKAIIETWILPQLTIGQRGFQTTVPLTQIVECIFHRLKTGCQWRELPTKQFFTDKVLTAPAARWNSVFYYYNKWSKAQCWKRVWINIFRQNLKHLDLSSLDSKTKCNTWGCC